MASYKGVTSVLREYHKWHSDNLNRDMEILIFGHGGARAIVIPTQSGRFFDWEDRGMINALSRHLENGWLQLFCVDSVDPESWDNAQAHPRNKAARHLQYQDYLIKEVIPFSEKKNDNYFLMCVGASFGAYHSISLAMRFPEPFKRVVAMSGIYDIRPWTAGYDDDLVYQGNPYEYVNGLNGSKLEDLRKIDLIITIGKDDPAFQENEELSRRLWDKGVWHAFRVWNGYAHDWPVWHDMILHYIGGPETKD